MRRERVLLAVAVVTCCLTLAAGAWSKARCIVDGDGWTDGEEYFAWCYTDIFPLWWTERLAEGAVPYLDHPVEYPVLTGGQMYLAQRIAQLAEPSAQPYVFLGATAAMNAVLALGVLAAMRAAGLPARRLLWWALAPALGVYAFLNWDPLVVLLMVSAIALHLRGRDGAAGIAAGLGVAAKLIPGLLVPLVIAARLAQRRPGAAGRHLLGAALAWLAIDVPVFLAAPEGFMRFWRFNSERSANFDSLWYLVEQVRGTPFPVPTLNLLSAGTLGLIAIVVLAVGTRRRPPEEWWSLALPLVCAFLLTNKVYSPQYTLWVIPLAALSLRYAAPFLAFVVADLALFLIEFPFLGGLAGTRLGPSFTVFAIALLARATTLVWILVASTLDHDPSLTARARPEAPRPEDRITAYEPSRLGASSHLLAVVRQPAWARPSR